MSPLIGTALDRVDGPRKVTGAARYAADEPVENLAQAALATRHLDLSSSPTLEDGLRRIAAAHRAASTDPDRWLQGHGWDSDRWGGWPTADVLDAVAPGRRIALWAHDHHALWASRAALRTAGVAPDTRTKPPMT